MYGRVLFVSLFMAGAAPSALAYDPFEEPFCYDEGICVGAGTCVADLGCVPRQCAPASCDAAVPIEGTECALNATIDGRTCATYSTVDVGTGGGTSVRAAAQSSNGSVHDLNLPNAWIAPGVELYVDTLGIDLGGVYAYFYTSDVSTEGPRGGPVGLASPAANHTWTQVGLALGAGSTDTALAVVLLDFMPEGCWARSPNGALPEIECPSLAPLYP